MKTKRGPGRPKLNLRSDNHSLLSRRINALKKRPTFAELHVCKLLNELGEHYQFQRGFFTEHRFFIVDFYFKRPRKLCLEIDGPAHKQQPAYDAMRDKFLTEKRRMRVVRISNEVAFSLTKEALKELISQ